MTRDVLESALRTRFGPDAFRAGAPPDPVAVFPARQAAWAAIMLARVLLSRLLLRVDRHVLVLGSAMLSAASVLVIGTAATSATAIAGVVLTGVALAGIFPTVLAVAGAEFREHAGTNGLDLGSILCPGVQP